MNHSVNTIIQVYKDIDSGRFTNFHFSDSNVVMVSKEYYYALVDLVTTLGTKLEN